MHTNNFKGKNPIHCPDSLEVHSKNEKMRSLESGKCFREMLKYWPEPATIFASVFSFEWINLEIWKWLSYIKNASTPQKIAGKVFCLAQRCCPGINGINWITDVFFIPEDHKHHVFLDAGSRVTWKQYFWSHICYIQLSVWNLEKIVWIFMVIRLNKFSFTVQFHVI